MSTQEGSALRPLEGWASPWEHIGAGARQFENGDNSGEKVLGKGIKRFLFVSFLWTEVGNILD